MAMQVAGMSQNLNVVPTPVKDVTVAKLSGPRIEKFEFSFQVPWNAVAIDRTWKEVASLGFTGGASLLVINPSSKTDWAKILREGAAHDVPALRQILPAKAMSSNYEWMSAIVRATPDDVKWWGSRSRNARALMMLGEKGTILGDSNSIHPIATEVLHGFQVGDPESTPYLVELELFDNSDRQYEIRINATHVHRAVITQSEINGLIASLQSVANHPVDKPASSGL
jgi:hypothetical protein